MIHGKKEGGGGGKRKDMWGKNRATHYIEGDFYSH